ncbi:hypothetical protein GGQ85_000337 [Nitrobacter vulgaris]|nr:hypothetical protein [Nitrobacter vulgaris]
MKLLSVTPSYGGNELARASIEVAAGIRLHDLKITRNGCVFARNATLDRAAVERIFNLVKGARHEPRAS